MVPWKETASGEALQRRDASGEPCAVCRLSQRQQEQTTRFASWLPRIFGSAEPYLWIGYLFKRLAFGLIRGRELALRARAVAVGVDGMLIYSL